MTPAQLLVLSACGLVGAAVFAVELRWHRKQSRHLASITSPQACPVCRGHKRTGALPCRRCYETGIVDRTRATYYVDPDCVGVGTSWTDNN